MQRCNRCVMPDTRPGSIFTGGVCQACLNYDMRQGVDWNQRRRELERLCSKYRRHDGGYDCVVPVSGGKDSHFVAYTLKNWDMHPLLVCVNDPFTHTRVGVHNLRNMRDTLNCDLQVIEINQETLRRATRRAFEETSEALMFIETAIYITSVRQAALLGIPLVVFGENSTFLYGTATEDNPSVRGVLTTGHSALGAKALPRTKEYWMQRGLLSEDLNAISLPTKLDVEPVFLSYYVPWDDEHNLTIARRLGLETLHNEWDREGCVEDYAQIDSIGYMVGLWLKYPNFGFSRTTDIVSRWIRKGMITREEGMRLVIEKDHKLDHRALDDFCEILRYTHKEFWDIVERFWNRDLFEKVDGIWKLKR